MKTQNVRKTKSRNKPANRRPLRFPAWILPLLAALVPLLTVLVSLLHEIRAFFF